VAGPCSVCDLVRGRPPEPVPVLHRDRVAVTFLARPGVVPGHTVVAPVRHAEAVVGDFSVSDHLDLQRRVHEVGTALAAVVPTGRLYVLGEPGGHVRWHLLPLPPGVPYGSLADLSRPAEPDLPPAEREDLAARMRALLAR
jgi:ATP adenylyltransferase